MAKTTTRPSSADPEHPELDRARLRERVVADLEAMPGLRELLEELELYPDLEAELDEVVPPLLCSPAPSRKVRRKYGVRFDVDEVRRFLEFALRLRHTKGRWAGSRFVPDLWQVVYVIGPVFGWRKKDGNRLVRTLYLEVPRKSGKSSLSAVLALFLLMADSNLAEGRLFEPGAEVYSAATTTRQAKEVFRPAEVMARRSPAIGNRLGIRSDEMLVYERTASRFEVLSGVPAKAEEKMGLNVSGVVIDELHVHKDRRLVDTLESATPARTQPLVVFITTAGLDSPGTIYDEKRELAERIATGDLEDPTTWAAIWSIPEELRDRWDELDVIRRANPGFGKSVSIEYLEAELVKARASDAKRLSFLRLHLNLRTGSSTAFLPLERWKDSGAFLTPTEAELARDYPVAYAGLDLSASTDLTAAVLVFPRWVDDPADPDFEVEVLEVLVRAWCPEASLARRDPVEAGLFASWIAKGVLRTTPGETVDYDVVEEELFALADRFELRRLHFDRWGSKQIVTHLRDGGLDVFEMGQGFASMSPALKELERLVLEKRLRHGGNPLLRWAVSGLVVAQDPAGNVKPDRTKSRTRIDPVVALTMAVDAYSRRETETTSAYEDRGVVIA